MNHRLPILVLAAGCVGALAASCALESNPQEASRVEAFRQALPAAEAMEIVGPEAEGAAVVASPVAAEETAVGAAGPAEVASYYVLTRDFRDGANAITAGVLGLVAHIAHSPPSEAGAESAVWGPYADPLEPAAWRLRIRHLGEEQFEYVLEGRPKASDSEGDYRSVLTGSGYGRAHPRHGDGQFSVDLDVARELDPVAHVGESGTVSVVHDLPRTVGEQIAPLPRTIEVALKPTASEEQLTIVSRAREDGTGAMALDGHFDIDDSKLTALEDVTILSQWNADGAGRADISVVGGDIPPAAGMVTAVQCWAPTFVQVHYSDNVGFAPPMGDVEACISDGPPEL